MKYDIQGGTMPVAICTLEAGEKMHTEGGAMAWMTPNISMATEGGGGLGKAIGRMFSGEKIFRNIYTCESGEGTIAFAPRIPGSIKVIEITPDKPIIAQKGAFLASTEGVQTEVAFTKKASAGLFGGEGFIMQKIYGTGLAFLEVDGSAIEYDLEAGQTMLIDTGNLVMMENTCDMDIQTVKGVKNVLFGGEGLFLTKISGPGKVMLQTLSIKELAEALMAYIPQQPSKS